MDPTYATITTNEELRLNLQGSPPGMNRHNQQGGPLEMNDEDYPYGRHDPFDNFRNDHKNATNGRESVMEQWKRQQKDKGSFGIFTFFLHFLFFWV